MGRVGSGFALVCTRPLRTRAARKASPAQPRNPSGRVRAPRWAAKKAKKPGKPRDYCKNRDISPKLGLIRLSLSLFRPNFRGPGGLLRPAGLLGLLGSPSQPGPTGWVSAQGWPSRPNNPAQPDPSRFLALANLFSLTVAT
jgi:hypothetical protein